MILNLDSIFKTNISHIPACLSLLVQAIGVEFLQFQLTTKKSSFVMCLYQTGFHLISEPLPSITTASLAPFFGPAAAKQVDPTIREKVPQRLTVVSR